MNNEEDGRQGAEGRRKPVADATSRADGQSSPQVFSCLLTSPVRFL